MLPATLCLLVLQQNDKALNKALAQIQGCQAWLSTMGGVRSSAVLCCPCVFCCQCIETDAMLWHVEHYVQLRWGVLG